GHNRNIFAHQPVGQREVERLAAVDRLGAVGYDGVAEGKSGPFQERAVFQPGDIELNLPVEAADRVVEIVTMAIAVPFQLEENVRIQLRDAVQHGRLDVIHVQRFAEVEAVLPGHAL